MSLPTGTSRRYLFHIVFAASLGLWPALHSAQTEWLSGPALGFVRDARNLSVRPILGIPGAALAGTPLEMATGLRRIGISLEKDYALGVAVQDATLTLVRNLSGSPEVETIETDGAVDILALSRNGAFAAVGSGNKVGLVRGLPSHPTLLWDFDPFITPEMKLTTLAVSNSGGIAAAFSDDHMAELYWLEGGQAPQLVANLGEVSALSFLPDGSGVVVADRLTKEVLLISGLPSNPIQFRLANEQDGVSIPSAVEVSNDGSQVVVANRDSEIIVLVDIKGGKPIGIPCGCQPTILTRLHGRFVIALTEPDNGPIVILEKTEDRVRFVVVPDAVQPEKPEPSEESTEIHSEDRQPN